MNIKFKNICNRLQIFYSTDCRFSKNEHFYLVISIIYHKALDILSNEPSNFKTTFMKKDFFVLNSLVRFISYSILVAVLLLFSGSEKIIAGNKDPGTEINTASLKGLKDNYRDFFPIGVDVSSTSLTG